MFFKRVFLFLLMNFLVVGMISVVLHLFNIGPYIASYGLDYQTLMIWCLIWGMGGALISLGMSRIMARWIMGVKRIDPNTQDPELRSILETVHQLARLAHLPAMPEVGIYRSNEVNAFATGPSRSRSLVAVSTGLVQRMKTEEIKAVLAHEISHVANGDMVTMTLLQGVVNAFVMFLARALAYAFSGLGRNQNNRENSHGGYTSYILFVYLFEVVFMILGSLVVAAYSRFREFRADQGGARLASKDSMISALQTLRVFQEVHDSKDENPAVAAFKISHGKKKGIFRFFSTHPPLEERIARLQKA
jgi:heat shock protein HtpX